MSNTTAVKLESAQAPTGELGQKYLASGKNVSLRLWDETPESARGIETQRAYETIGYVISGRAELHLEGETVTLQAGSSWIVPQGARHSYTILEPFTAVEATSPPAERNGLDKE